MVVLRLALPNVAFFGVHIIRLRRTVFVETVGNALVGERNVLQTLFDRGGRGIVGQRPNARRMPPEMIGRERRRVDRVLHAGLGQYPSRSRRLRSILRWRRMHSA